MCLPITHSDGRIIGVAQAINKGDNSSDFTDKDHQVNIGISLRTQAILFGGGGVELSSSDPLSATSKKRMEWMTLESDETT